MKKETPNKTEERTKKIAVNIPWDPNNLTPEQKKTQEKALADLSKMFDL